MTRHQHPEEAAIERAIRFYGPVVQAKCISQRMQGMRGSKLTATQVGNVLRFQIQLDTTTFLSDRMSYIQPEDICQARIDALAAAIRALLADAPTAAERSRIFQAGRIAVRSIRDQHATHLALQSRAEEPSFHERLKADADRLFGSAWDRIERERGEQ